MELSRIYLHFNDSKYQCVISKLKQPFELWQTTFNIDKCKAMHIGRSNLNTRYYMNNHKLAVIETEEDLGVTISNDLKVSV